MSINTQPKDIRTLAYIIKRTNYGEADRVLNILTPEGKMSAMAKGVRKEKSKLAGNIEMFCLIDMNIHQGRNEFGVVTSAKMLKFYSNLIIDLPRMELASMILKKINIVSETINSKEYFNIVDQTLSALDEKMDEDLVEAWFWFNLAKNSGEEVNLYFDIDGKKLVEGKTYVWDNHELALKEQMGGNIGSNEIKIMRLMLTSKLTLINRVKDLSSKIPSILYIAKSINKI